MVGVDLTQEGPHTGVHLGQHRRNRRGVVRVRVRDGPAGGVGGRVVPVDAVGADRDHIVRLGDLVGIHLPRCVGEFQPNLAQGGRQVGIDDGIGPQSGRRDAEPARGIELDQRRRSLRPGRVVLVEDEHRREPHIADAALGLARLLDLRQRHVARQYRQKGGHLGGGREVRVIGEHQAPQHVPVHRTVRVGHQPVHHTFELGGDVRIKIAWLWLAHDGMVTYSGRLRDAPLQELPKCSPDV